ncbi:unnamed protein product [Ostreobium quekettii]|uniref:F-box/LRR-repeat protein 15-like leucin rich repeat domain-containing protein n=1 Tax=Ostreobium quekettii TaxID=121088 RepID=A0A8S1JBY8_9CHLO|nr:unnamed protein product [Ostreobium quekettii]|eukprot:evm.model.scf_281.11 EVM.evm.TU.scf_281.11   scf_281:90073-91717(-)
MSSEGPPEAVSDWSRLPSGVLELLVAGLRAGDRGAARAACTTWRRGVDGCTTSLRCSPACRVCADRLVRLFPHLTALDVGLGCQWVQQGSLFEDVGGGLAALGGLDELRRLSLSGWSDLGDGDAPALAGMSCLTSLDLTFCTGITGGALYSLLALGSLTSLNLTGCSSIQDDGFHVLGFLTGLKCLNLSGCQVTEDGVRFLGNLTNLASLHLLECTKLTDNALACVLPLLVNSLTELDLSECSSLTNKVGPTLRACTQLRVLNLQGCDRIRGMDFMASELTKLPSLEKLIVMEGGQDGGGHCDLLLGSSDEEFAELGEARDRGSNAECSSESNSSGFCGEPPVKRRRWARTQGPQPKFS